MRFRIKDVLAFRPTFKFSRKQILAGAAISSALVILIGIQVAGSKTTDQAMSPKTVLGGLGKIAHNVATGHLSSPSPSSHPTPSTGSPIPSVSQVAAPSSKNPSVPTSGSVPSTSTPMLLMTLQTYVLGSSQSPILYSRDAGYINTPPTQNTADLTLEWYRLQDGANINGVNHQAWRPGIFRKNTDHDGEATFNIVSTDLLGRTHSTTFKIVYFANRQLILQAGSLDKRIEGDKVIFTGHVNFAPTSNIGNPVVHIISSGFYNFSDPCTIGHTDASFTYAGQTGYDVTCTTTTSALSQYYGGFDIIVNAEVRWPVQTANIFSTKFHAE